MSDPYLSPGTTQRQLDGREWESFEPDNDNEPDRHEDDDEVAYEPRDRAD